MPRNEITLDDVREWIKTDKHTLDDDLERHPQYVSDVSDAYAFAKDEARRAKQELDELYAYLDAQCRLGEKISETQIKMRITDHPKMKAAERKHLDAKLKEDLWYAAMEKIKAKGYAINSLGSLYEASYFARESVGGKRSNVVEGRAQRARELRARGRDET